MISIFRSILKNAFSFILHPIRQLASFFRRVIPGLKWLSSLKPELLIAVLTFIFLLIIWLIVRFGGGIDQAAAKTQAIKWYITLAVIVAIPIVLYFFLRILFQPPKSPFPDIDESWTLGLQELEKNGLVLKDLPLYLVLGMQDAKQIRTFIEASGKSFDVDGATGSGQTLIWYASKDEIFLFLSHVGNYTEFSAKTKKLPSLHSDQDEQDFTHTANIKDFYNIPKHQVEDDADEDSEVDIMSTVRAADITPDQSQPTEPAKATTEDSPRERVSARAKYSEQRKRLNHLCNLVRRGRQPVSPVNGILVNANVRVVESYPDEMARQLRDDLASLTSELGLICAMTVVVSGLERDRGFINFADRLIHENGPEFAKSKFGKSYRTWTPASNEQLEQVARSAVEEFDHFVHLIFTKRDALSAENVQGNRNLVLFICRLYSSILPGLKTLLAKGCAAPQMSDDPEFPRFAGCYFVGNDEHHDYFLRKVFDRVEENQGELEWTEGSLRREENWQILTNLCYLIGLASLIAFAFLWFYYKDQS